MITTSAKIFIFLTNTSQSAKYFCSIKVVHLQVKLKKWITHQYTELHKNQ